MISSVTVELKNLRKNGKNAHYVVAKKNGSKYYETLREAVYDSIITRDGDIIEKGSNRLLAFWSDWHNSMRFGFGACDLDKNTMKRDLWWADWDQTKPSFYRFREKKRI